MYPGTPTHLASARTKTTSSNVSGFYVSEDLRLEALHRNALVLAQPDPEQNPGKEDSLSLLISVVHKYLRNILML